MKVQRFQMGTRMSQAVKASGIVALSGQVSDIGGDITRQAEDIFAKIDTLLQAAGTDKSKLLSATIWLSDMAYYDQFNSVWDNWIDPFNPPARACVQARLVKAEWVVEVQVLALA